jgi:hypothetical protein
MMISVKTFMHQKQTLAKIKCPEKWHPHQSHHMVTTCAAKSAWYPGNTPNKDSLGGGLMGGVSIGLDSDRAGSLTL